MIKMLLRQKRKIKNNQLIKATPISMMIPTRMRVAAMTKVMVPKIFQKPLPRKTKRRRKINLHML
jgi:hypothetical protein